MLGTLACVLILSNYTVIAGWVMAYAWKPGSALRDRSWVCRGHRGAFHGFSFEPGHVGFWHTVFLVIVGSISARGLNRGIEIANKIRAPGLLILLLALVAYALVEGDALRGLPLRFNPI